MPSPKHRSVKKSKRDREAAVSPDPSDDGHDSDAAGKTDDGKRVQDSDDGARKGKVNASSKRRDHSATDSDADDDRPLVSAKQRPTPAKSKVERPKQPKEKKPRQPKMVVRHQSPPKARPCGPRIDVEALLEAAKLANQVILAKGQQ